MMKALPRFSVSMAAFLKEVTCMLADPESDPTTANCCIPRRSPSKAGGHKFEGSAAVEGYGIGCSPRPSLPLEGSTDPGSPALGCLALLCQFESSTSQLSPAPGCSGFVWWPGGGSGPPKDAPGGPAKLLRCTSDACPELAGGQCRMRFAWGSSSGQSSKPSSSKGPPSKTRPRPRAALSGSCIGWAG